MTWLRLLLISYPVACILFCIAWGTIAKLGGTTPSAPTTPQTITLAWTEPTGGSVDAYNLYMGEVSGQYAGFIRLSGNQTSIRVLINHQNTCFALSAVAGAQESVLSNEVCFQVP